MGRGPLLASLVLLVCLLGCGPGSAPQPDNPLTGETLWVDPQSAPAQAEQQLRRDGANADADTLHAISSQPVATWLVDDDPRTATQRVVQQAEVLDQLPVLVLYHRPGRDCGSYSAGGAAEQSSYLSWVGAVSDAIGDRRALVIVEPDAIPQAVSGQCSVDGRPDATYAMLSAAVSDLADNPGTVVYLDAGHPGWITDTDALADALRRSGVEQAAGFSLNVSNFVSTDDNQSYGDRISAALEDVQYVVDVSRNGRGAPDADPGSVEAWCNPPSAALGENPHLGPQRARAVAFLWIKEPGASDGSCRPGEPPAGEFWVDSALRLIRQRP
ncbi:MAG TPA: glycoside hydrolase family 6 protein [Microlunatus sp.]|nr:glycoside hydrolase family 6 protein [Microlunatus sp.]